MILIIYLAIAGIAILWLFFDVAWEAGRAYESRMFELERRALLRALHNAEVENLRHQTRNSN
jgi:hypothetical protein